MKINFQRLTVSLLVGLVIASPILLNYVFGTGLEDTFIEALASAVAIPAMFLLMILFPLAWIVPDPDTYVLGVYFLLIPVGSILFYGACAYAVALLITRKK